VTNTRELVFLLILSGVVVILSIFFIGNTELKNDRVIVSSGFPITFVEQESTYSVEDYDKIQNVRMLSPLENPTKIIWSRMGISLVAVYGFLVALFKGIRFKLARK
jgi:hypothetical protein